MSAAAVPSPALAAVTAEADAVSEQSELPHAREKEASTATMDAVLTMTKSMSIEDLTGGEGIRGKDSSMNSQNISLISHDSQGNSPDDNNELGASIQNSTHVDTVCQGANLSHVYYSVRSGRRSAMVIKSLTYTNCFAPVTASQVTLDNFCGSFETDNRIERANNHFHFDQKRNVSLSFLSNNLMCNTCDGHPHPILVPISPSCFVLSD